MDTILRMANCQPSCAFQYVSTAAIVDLLASFARLGRRGVCPYVFAKC
jgi:hypothetical protein